MFSKKRPESSSTGRGKKSSSLSGRKSPISSENMDALYKLADSDGNEANFNREENNVSGFEYSIEKKERKSFRSTSGTVRKFNSNIISGKKEGGQFGKSVKRSTGKPIKVNKYHNKEWEREKPDFTRRRNSKFVKPVEREKKFRGFSAESEKKPPRSKKRIEKYSPADFVDFSDTSISESTELTEMQRNTENNFTPHEKKFSLESLQIPEHLMDEGRIVFGSKTNFKNWLMIPNASLGNIQPATLLDNKEGRKIIESELMRISFGVFS